jgi:hypothetical protein
MYVLVPVPNLTRQDQLVSRGGTARRSPEQAFRVQQGYPSDVITQEIVTPVDWQRRGWPQSHRLRSPQLWPNRTFPSIKRPATASSNVLPGFRDSYGELALPWRLSPANL